MSQAEESVSLREAQKQLTLQKLVEAARSAFHTKGYSATTVDDIVEQAGASRGTFYLHFKSKGEVLAALFNDEHIEAVLTLLQQFPSEPDVRALRDWIGRYLTLYAEHRLTIRAWIQAGSREADLRAESLTMMDRVLDSLSDHVLEARRMQKQTATDADARVRSLLMFIQLQEFAYYRNIREYPVDERRSVDLLAELWHAALYGDVAKPAGRR